MKFALERINIRQNSNLIFRKEEHSFDVEPFEGGGVSSVMVNDLQLEIDENGKILYVWGYCPLINYETTNEFPKEYKSNGLIALLDGHPTPGVSYRLNEDRRWPIYINKKKGWVCLGNPKVTDKQLVEFAPNCIAAMQEQEIVAVWLHPDKLP